MAMDIIHHILVMGSGSQDLSLLILLTGKGIFGVPVSFVIGFLLKLFLIFLISAGISKLFHLDKAYDDMEQHRRNDF
jgi:hypothetical protein